MPPTNTLNELRNTAFMTCKLNHAVKSLDRRGFLGRRAIITLQQVMSERRWVVLLRQLNSLRGVNVKVADNKPLSSGNTEVTLTVDRAIRAKTHRRLEAAQEGVSLKRSGMCRSIW